MKYLLLFLIIIFLLFIIIPLPETLNLKGQEFYQKISTFWQKTEGFIITFWNSYIKPKVNSFLEKEVEERKSEIKEEFEKEKQEMKKDIPEVSKLLWEEFKKLIK